MTEILDPGSSALSELDATAIVPSFMSHYAATAHADDPGVQGGTDRALVLRSIEVTPIWYGDGGHALSAQREG
jgi:hypothetical protein